MHAGVGDRDVDPPEPLDGRGHGGTERARIGHVRLERGGSVVAELVGDRIQQLRFDPDQRDARAGPVQPRRDRRSDSTRGASDQHNPPACP